MKWQPVGSAGSIRCVWWAQILVSYSLYGRNVSTSLSDGGGRWFSTKLWRLSWRMSFPNLKRIWGAPVLPGAFTFLSRHYGSSKLTILSELGETAKNLKGIVLVVFRGPRRRFCKILHRCAQNRPEQSSAVPLREAQLSSILASFLPRL